MPNPFEKKPALAVEVTDSELWCEKCWTVTENGLYYSETQTLTWECSNGHKNELKIDLD